MPPISQPMLTASRLTVGTSEFGSTCRQNTMLSGMPRARAAVATSDRSASTIAARRLRASTVDSDSEMVRLGRKRCASLSPNVLP